MAIFRSASAAVLLGLLATAALTGPAFATPPPANGAAAQPAGNRDGFSPDKIAVATPAETMLPAGHQASDQALPAAAEDKTANGSVTELLAPPEPTLFADIDLTHQVMTVSDKRGEIGRWKISSARGGYSTPTGTYTVHYTSRMHYSKQYGFAPMPYSVFFNEGVAVHGTNAVGQLGRPASHGCVRAHPANAKIFYNLVEKHGMQLTRVTVHGKPPYSPAVADSPRRRYQYQGPSYQPFGFFSAQPAFDQRRPRRQQRYGGGNYGAW